MKSAQNKGCDGLPLNGMNPRSVTDFKGKIPAIAEKEKRGKRIKVPKSEIYVQELTTNASINIPPVN